MLEVVRAFVGVGALGGAVAVGTGAAADPGAHVAVLAGEDLAVWSLTQARAAGSPGEKKLFAALCR